MSGFMEDKRDMNSDCLTGEIINGIQFPVTLLSKVIAMRLPKDAAGAASHEFVGLIDWIPIMGYLQTLNHE